MTEKISYAEQLALHFNKLRQALPIAAEAKPLGFGSFGIALEEGETVNKILFRPEEKAQQEGVMRLFWRETNALGAFEKCDMQGVEVPVLIGEPEILDHPQYMARYRMTRINGHTHPPQEFEQVTENRPEYNELFRKGGALLARFHSAISNLKWQPAPMSGHGFGTHITTLEGAGKARNEGLAAAGRFLRASIKPGNIHGDFHYLNVMMRDDEPVGLIDFANMGHAPNKMSDSWNIPGLYVPAFAEGYKQQSGEDVLPVIIATRLSWLTHYVTSLEGQPADELDREEIFDEVDQLLGQLRPVIGA